MASQLHLGTGSLARRRVRQSGHFVPLGLAHGFRGSLHHLLAAAVRDQFLRFSVDDISTAQAMKQDAVVSLHDLLLMSGTLRSATLPLRFALSAAADLVSVGDTPGAENVLPWLDEQANLRKEKNFFETRVTEYQTGGALAWD